MGLFNLAQKHTQTSPQSRPSTTQHDDDRPPPPPYDRDHGPELMLAPEASMTQAPTQTTHFFSLPLWRRRPAPRTASGSARRSVVGVEAADELGALDAAHTHHLASAPLKVDKSLPPTPASDDGSAPFAPPGLIPRTATPPPPPILLPAFARPSLGGRESMQAGSPLSASPVVGSPPPDQPTFALARAALGIGLPHVMPRQVSATAAAAAPSPTDVNTVAFLDVASGSSTMRRMRSFQKPVPAPEPVPEPEQPAAPAGSANSTMRRRTRGLSLGPWQFAAGGAADVKGKGKAREDGAAGLDRPSSSPTVTRKSSFFGRKRKESNKLAPAPPVPPSPVLAKATAAPMLPAIPVSPFDVGSGSPGSPRPRMGLRRHNSERRHSQQSMSMLSFMQTSSPPLPSPSASGLPTPPPGPARGPPSPQAERKLRRPQTADAAAAERARAHSMYIERPPTEPTELTAPPVPFVPSSSSSNSLLAAPRPSSSFPSSDPPGPRQRSQTNPPRLSLSMFSMSSSPSNNTLVASPSASPRISYTKPSSESLKPRAEESPELYIERLAEIVSKAEMASVLATSADPFHATALRVYIGRYEYFNDPLDVALRKLLMHVGLPRETQQIDRVIEAFATRYAECNPNLFASEDQAYVLAFSLIMLHTDAFNKSNKRKMTKADYVKNTRLPGVPPEVLEYFFDNVCFAPFIFIEDPDEANGSRGSTLPPDPTPMPVPPAITPLGSVTPGGSLILARGPKIDPYYLIARNLLDQLRVATERYVPWESPYNYKGTAGPWDEEEIRRAFASAMTLDIGGVELVQPSFFTMPVAGTAQPLMGVSGALPEPVLNTGRETWTLKVTKVGALQRKDDKIEGGRRGGFRKWRECTLVLTGSQLLFYREPGWAAALLAGTDEPEMRAALMRPDELLSVRDAVAVIDSSYKKYPNTLRFALANGRHILLRAAEEREMNEWISLINYASAFKSASVRVRPMGMTSQEIELTGIAAAASHLKTLHQPKAAPVIRHWDGPASTSTAGGLLEAVDTAELPGSVPDVEQPSSPISLAASDKMDMDMAVPPQIESGPQFKAIFDRTKADLAALETQVESPLDSAPPMALHAIAPAVASPVTSPGAFPSRAALVQARIRDLDDRLRATRTQLEADMRFVRAVALATPFQHTTRERLEAAVRGAAGRIMHVRLELARLTCHRDVLEDDLGAAGQEWRHTSAIALRAALDTIESTRPAPDAVQDSPVDEDGLYDVPRSSACPIPGGGRSAIRTSTADTGRRASSITGSFYSATDFGIDWSEAGSTDDEPPPSPPSPPRSTSISASASEALSTPAILPARDASDEYPFPAAANGRVRALTGHERFYTAQEHSSADALPRSPPHEEAQDWNLTQAARRVSLVKLPSDLRISAVFRRSRPPRSADASPSLASPRPSRESARASPGAQ